MYILDITDVTDYGINGTDEQKTAFINQAEAYIHNYCNVESFQEKNGIVEEKELSNDKTYFLDYPNIRNVNEVEGEIIDSTDWRKTGNCVRFKSDVNIEANEDWGTVEITYDAGYTTIPQALKDAALFLVTEYAKSVSTAGSGALKEIKIGDLTEKYDVGTSGGTTSGNIEKANEILNAFVVLRSYSN